MYTAAKKIEQLREQGWKVKVRIERIIGYEDGPEGPIPIYASRADGVDGREFSPRGGKTQVTLTPVGGDSERVRIGIAFCHSEKDNFNNKIGLEIALARALKSKETEM